jgi:hypothetical protein
MDFKAHYCVYKIPPLIRRIQSTPPSISLRSVSVYPLFYVYVFLVVSFFPVVPSHILYMNCPCHPPWLHHYNYIWRPVEVIKFLMKQFFPTYYYILVGLKYCNQYLDLKTKYILVSRDQNAGQTREIKIGNRSFGNVSQFSIWKRQ